MTPIFWQAPNDGPLINLNHIVSIDRVPTSNKMRVLLTQSGATVILEANAERSLLDAIAKYVCNPPTETP